MEIKRIDMKRHIKPKLIKTFTSLYLGKHCKHHNFSLTYKSFTNSGFSIKLDHYLFTAQVNVYPNGEVSYIFGSMGNMGERTIIIEPDEFYDEWAVDAAIDDFIDLTKKTIKLAIDGHYFP